MSNQELKNLMEEINSLSKKGIAQELRKLRNPQDCSAQDLKKIVKRASIKLGCNEEEAKEIAENFTGPFAA